MQPPSGKPKKPNTEKGHNFPFLGGKRLIHSGAPDVVQTPKQHEDRRPVAGPKGSPNRREGVSRTWFKPPSAVDADR